MINDKNPASLKKHMRGAETVEYVILAALVATTLAIAMPRLASSVGDKMTDVSTDLDRTGGGGGSIGGGGTGGDGDDGTGGDDDETDDSSPCLKITEPKQCKNGCNWNGRDKCQPSKK